MTHTAAAAGFDMVPPTGRGRSFATRRRVRLGDATPHGRMRLDAMARFLQDVSNDDSRDAEWSDPHWWVVRRTVLDVAIFPTYLQEVDIVTWCGGTGTHWAERRTRMSAIDGTPLVDAAALWVHIDSDKMQPSRIPDDVLPMLSESAEGRRIGARLLLKAVDFPTSEAVASPWVLRFSDFDAVGHMNNAAYWEVVEEQLASHRSLRAPMRAIVEHIVEVEPGAALTAAVVVDGDVSVQMRVGDVVHAAAWAGPLTP